MFCLGCGDDLSGKESDRRNFKSSQDVFLLWKAFVDRLSVDSLSINIDSYGEMMCRKCYYVYKRFLLQTFVDPSTWNSQA